MAEPFPVVLYPDPRLRRPTKSVAAVDESIRSTVERMIATMHRAGGIGIAAPQVGWDRRVCIVSGTGDPGDELVLVNPRIVKEEGTARMNEGCLSFPGISAQIVRSGEVTVEYLDLEGKPTSLSTGGLLGRCVLHEVDHLDGVVFTTHFTPADRIRLKTALRDLEERCAGASSRRPPFPGRAAVAGPGRPGMHVHGLEDLSPALFRRPVAALGVFDGVHLGHRAVFDAAADLARTAGGEPVAVTFDRHPRIVVEGKGPGMLTSLPHRLLLLEAAGVAAAVVLRFDAALRERSAEWFLEEVLVARMGIAGLVLGPDSHFGKDRRGNPALARSILEARGIPVRSVGRVAGSHGPVSSTAVREAVQAGDFDRAAALLGRPFSVLGTVVRGDGRGRTLGYPTANLDLAREIRPPRGVYAGRAKLPGGRALPCLVNVGGRPTFLPEGGEDTVEAWIPGFDGDLYGQVLDVALLVRLREERKFESAEALQAQIRRDHEAMVDWIRRGTPGPPLHDGGAGAGRS